MRPVRVIRLSEPLTLHSAQGNFASLSACLSARRTVRWVVRAVATLLAAAGTKESTMKVKTTACRPSA